MNKLLKPGARPFFTGLAFVFAVSFALTMWMAFHVPIYSDEPEWKLIGSRILLDAGKLIYLFPACDASQWLDTPLTWYPTRLLDALIYQDASNPFQLRIFGTILFFVLLAAWTTILHITSRLPLASSGLFVISYFSFGVLPFLMVFNRPEQSLLIWLTGGLFAMLWFDKHRVSGLAGKCLLTAFFALLACVIAATHPKGLFFFPVLLLAWWRPVKSLPLGLGLLGVMAWTALETVQIWQVRTVCAESPWLTNILQTLSLQPQQLMHNPGEFFGAGKANLAAFVSYVRGIQFQADYQSMWLPATPHVSSSLPIGVLINALAWLPLIVAAIMLTVNLIRQLSTRQASRTPVALMLALTLTMLVLLQSNKNFYEAGVVFPLVLLVCLFTFTPDDEGAPNRLVSHLLLPVMLVGASVAGYARYDLFWDHAQKWRADRTHGPIDNASLRSFVQEQCGISDASENLLLSSETYPAFWQHRRPMFLPYVTGWWATGTDYKQTLAKRDPGGLITSCQGVPTEMTGIIKESRGYCCASAADLKQFSRP